MPYKMKKRVWRELSVDQVKELTNAEIPDRFLVYALNRFALLLCSDPSLPLDVLRRWVCQGNRDTTLEVFDAALRVHIAAGRLIVKSRPITIKEEDESGNVNEYEDELLQVFKTKKLAEWWKSESDHQRSVSDIPSNATQTKQSKNKRGRPSMIERDMSLVDKYDKHRDRYPTKAEFARQEGMEPDAMGKALARGRKHRNKTRR